MAKIEKLGEQYTYEDGTDSFSVSFLLPGIIALFGKNIEFFDNPKNLRIGACLEEFKDIESIKKAATTNIEGKINKEKLIQSIQRSPIKENDKQTLLMFASTIPKDMRPETLRRQLIIRNLDAYLPYLEFEEQTEELIETCNQFKKFLDEYRKQKSRR